MMKNYAISFIILFLTQFGSACAQDKVWKSPCSGYSNTSKLTVDTIKFKKNMTLVYVTANGKGGSSIRISSHSRLKVKEKYYTIQSASEVGLDKIYSMPDSGKVHFVMQFNPVPNNTKVMHFSEGVDNGWIICNIRKEKGDLSEIIPREWREVEYEESEELPESKFSDDSTRIHVKILNYTPEAGKCLMVRIDPIDFDASELKKSYDISSKGTAIVRLHPCYPQTVQMRIGMGEYFPVLIVPGKDLSILMDMGKSDTDAVVNFKGALAKTNYEVNVKGAKKIFHYRNEESYFDSLLYKASDSEAEFMRNFYRNNAEIERSDFSPSTKEWMKMNNEFLHCFTVDNLYNSYVTRKIQKEMRDADLAIAKNERLLSSMTGVLRIPYNPDYPYSFCNSKKVTMCPHYLRLYDYVRGKNDENVSSLYRDLYIYRRAIVWGVSNNDCSGQQLLEQVKDSTLRVYYPVFLERWKKHVNELNKTPHIHFDENEGMEGEVLKKNILEENKGKKVVFLVYDRLYASDGLDEVDHLIRKSNRKDVVFVHIDKRDAPIEGVRPWYEFAKRKKGEHYSGYRTRYYTMFPHYDGLGILFSFYDSSGNNTLETQDKAQAFDAIKRMLNKM